MPQPSDTTMNIPQMSVKRLRQELTQRGLAADGLKPALVERLEFAVWKNSNEAFHSCTKQIKDAAAVIATAEEDVAALEEERAKLEAELAANQHKLDAARQRIPLLNREQSEAQRELNELEPRLFFAPKLPACVLLSIVGQLGRRTGQRAACVCREWRGSVAMAKGLGMYVVKLLSIAAGGSMTAVCACTAKGDIFTFGKGNFGQLGHGVQENVHVPRLVEALLGKKAIGVSAGGNHTAVWTDDGELFTFGYGAHGKLGHGGTQNELVPRLVEALVGKKVVGASAGTNHTAVWTEAGELFTFGYGSQ